LDISLVHLWAERTDFLVPWKLCSCELAVHSAQIGFSTGTSFVTNHDWFDFFKTLTDKSPFSSLYRCNQLYVFFSFLLRH
jgi:hypothetical protein